ncbi:conserved hypothetical protein [Sulfurimonas denitrificans DSM 1251]|uniref:Uncharacterized protein n=1 Tax=Sulfurimonas denitrificans (strain ATCC 33889 / DSM 1251) TaxID=326298 RepID=Q30U58_SULDN|nr:methyltransferase domain-containing protein [Sulfurimonas denitrificans]ABB43473.1 conserved hypothetical protein [Sulfurimonas denitrificans DSM 1251]
MKKRIEVLHKIIAQKQKGTKDKRMYSYLNTKKYGYEKINNYFCGENVLELGTDGSSTSSILVRWSKKLTIVDMHDKFTSQIQKDEKLKDVNFILSSWEEYKPDEKFSDIFLTDSLEHIQEPVKLLKLIKNWLSEDGRLHIIVPNALSIHRLVGVEMGFLSSPYELNDNDISSNHIKVYDHNILKQEIKDAGLNIVVCEGVQFKPNTDIQLADLDENFSRALNNLSYMFNEYCAEIYVCCKL